MLKSYVHRYEQILAVIPDDFEVLSNLGDCYIKLAEVTVSSKRLLIKFFVVSISMYVSYCVFRQKGMIDGKLSVCIMRKPWLLLRRHVQAVMTWTETSPVFCSTGGLVSCPLPRWMSSLIMNV